MKLTFHLNEAIYNCVLRIRDGSGVRAYELSTQALAGEMLRDSLTVTVTGGECELMVSPKCIEQIREELRDFKGDSFLETLGVKLMGKLTTSLYESALLLTACTYRLSLRERVGREVMGSDAIHLHLTERYYACGWKWVREWGELFPVTYTFFELSEGEAALSPVDARGLNRYDLLKLARRLTMVQCSDFVIAYPFLMGRIKRMTRDRRVYRRLRRLYRLSPEKRQSRFEEQEKPVLGTL